MNYNISCGTREYRFSYNYINTVGDLQAIIIQSLHLPREKVLFISHDLSILGIDYEFSDNLLDHNLVDVNLFVILDPASAGTGTKPVFQEWLQIQIQGHSIMDDHRQIIYHHTLQSQLAGNVGFFAQGGGSPSNPSLRTTGPPSIRPQNRSNNGLNSGFGSSFSSHGSSSNLSNEIFGTGLNSSNNNSLGSNSNNNSLGNSSLGNSSGNNSSTLGNASFLTTLSNLMSSQNSSSSSSNSNNNSASDAFQFGSMTGGSGNSEVTINFETAGGEGQGNQSGQISFSGSNGTNPGQVFQQLFQGLSPSTTQNTNDDNSFSSIIQELMNRHDIHNFGITVSSGPILLDQVPEGNDFFNFILNNLNLESVPVTLTREGINRLPTFHYSELPEEIKRDDGNNSTESACCSVCREEYENDDDVRVLLCRHYFHKECIDRWLSEGSVRCPLCRHDNREETSSNDSRRRRARRNSRTTNSNSNRRINLRRRQEDSSNNDDNDNETN